jgi:hypothetical protein
MSWLREFFTAEDRWSIREPIFYAAVVTLIVAGVAVAPL